MANGRHGPRMDKEWQVIGGIELLLTGAGTSLSLGLAPGTAATVIRMIGEYLILNTGSVVVLDSVQIAVGIGVFLTDAFIAGATPDPAQEPEFPWLYWKTHALNFPATGSPQNPAAGHAFVRQAFDIRSMRKMKPRETLAMVVEYVNIVGNPPITVDLTGTRVLLAGI